MSQLSVQNVVKDYGDFRAVNHVSFNAIQGRIFGLLGPNGAGKTSTIRMITYITAPDSGQILFNDKPVGQWSQEIMGYLPEERGLYKKMKVGEQLEYLLQLKGLSAKESRKAVRHWLNRFDAKDWYGKKVEELSKGMQQKVQFIATIAHDPELLIFDEPFSGLDPINAELLKEVILELKDRNKTILFASHRMDQVEQMCDDIGLVSNGSLILNGDLREIKNAAGRNTVNLEFDGATDFLSKLESEGKVRLNSVSHHFAEIRLLNDTPADLILKLAQENCDEIYKYEIVVPSLNEIFITAVQGQKGEEVTV